MKKEIRCAGCQCNLTFVFAPEEFEGEVFCKKCWNYECIEEEIDKLDCCCVNGCDWCLDIEPRSFR